MPKNPENIPLGMGAKKDKFDGRDFRLASIQAPVSLPSKFLVDDKFAPNHQFSRGSCTSQAQAHHKERQEEMPLAARFIMSLTKKMEGNSDYGAYTRNTFKIVKDNGVCEENLYPEPDPSMSWNDYINSNKIPAKCYTNANKHKSSSFWRVDNTVNGIKQAIFQNKNSVVISMDWFYSFNRPKSDGMLPKPDYSVGGHAVDVIGWDDTKLALRVKNSWGSEWGDHGYFWLPYEFIDKVWDAWCSLDIPEKFPVDDRYGIKRTWNSYLRERSMALNPWLVKKINRLPNNREINAMAYGFWSFDSVFNGKVKDIWLKITKPAAIKAKLIDQKENLL